MVFDAWRGRSKLDLPGVGRPGRNAEPVAKRGEQIGSRDYGQSKRVEATLPRKFAMRNHVGDRTATQHR